MELKKTSEETEQQKEAFKRHLDEASVVVASWEPWERGILGVTQNGKSSAEVVSFEKANRNGCANNSEE